MLWTVMWWYQYIGNILYHILLCANEAEFTCQEVKHVSLFSFSKKVPFESVPDLSWGKFGCERFCTTHLEFFTIKNLNYYVCSDFLKESDYVETKLVSDDTIEVQVLLQNINSKTPRLATVLGVGIITGGQPSMYMGMIRPYK